MAEIIRMPRMSDTMEEGNIVAWLKKVGDKVAPGDVLAEVETDKATMDLESYQEGTLLYIGVEKGTIPVNAVLAIIGKEGEDYTQLLATTKHEASAATTPVPAPEAPLVAAATAPPGTVPATATATPPPAAVSSPVESQRTKASPLAKNMAQEGGIDIHTLNGSGEGGRIVKRDIEAALSQQHHTPTPAPIATPSAPASAVAASATELYEDIPVSQMRKVIAKRLGESKFSAPHFYLTIAIDMDAAIKTRQEVNALIAPAKISYNDMVIKAVAAALRQHPAVNSSWLGDTIRRHHSINIGVAVAVDEGLLVPVVRNADAKTMSQINNEVRELAAKAKDRKLQPAEMQGNTFTISNLGMFDIEEFTAIINPPDACILAVGAIAATPVIKDGQVVAGNIMKVTLSCDHRVVDGATGAQFLQTLKAMLENPIRMII